MEQRLPRVPNLAWVEEEEEGPGAAPAVEAEEVVPFHPLQEDAALERTQEQESSRGRFHSTAQAEKMRGLTERLVELLQENESNVIRMTILLLRYLLLDNGAPIPTPIALQLAEALLPLFDHDDSQVQLSSMCVFQEMLELVTEDGRKALKCHVRQSLVPLSFHCHDGNKIVAELAQDRSRAAEQLRQALRYLRSPQESLRAAAIRFMGMAGRHLRGQQQELQLICTALEEMACDSSPAIRNLSAEAGFVLRAVQRAPYSTWRKLQDEFRSAWKKRPRLCHRALLFCWNSV
ncbi:uncharacterized protein LOC135461219 [Zonotrichia leucophrys gambelii]|uniref:uncharacterized protein LOC135461219 n=1 Tax=Zonotrichia leucophrys gambelii TaxID=257770 RepID=UPI00314021E1